MITLEIFNHGKGSEPDVPCGEVDVFNVTGENLHIDLLKELTSDEPSGLKSEWFRDLPTETPVKVKAEISNEGGYWLHVLEHEILDHR